MSKPRISYSEFAAKQMKYAEGTVAHWIERYVRKQDGSKQPLGDSHRYVLRRLQRESFTQKPATELTKRDVIAYAEERIKNVAPATINQELAYLSGVLKYVESAWDEKVSDKPIRKAKPFLDREGMIGKSAPRTARPSAEQIAMLLAYFEEQNKSDACKTDMALVTRWQIVSARRIGETCALLWRDWIPEDQVVLVRRMKDPRGPKAKVVALPEKAQAMLMDMAYAMDTDPELRTDEPRIFPFRTRTCVARYVLAKKDLGIENLHLHDNRREAITRLIEDEKFAPEEVMLVSGHETTAILQRTYMKQDPARFKLGPKSMRAA